MRRLLSVLLCLMISIGLATAQSTKVSGVVTSAEDGLPVIGASVMAKGKAGLGTVTDHNGRFTIEIPATVKDLIFSYVGMESQIITASSHMRIVMGADTKSLEEVVIVGYGSARKIGTTVGSVAKVSSEALESRPQASALESLQGQVPGLQVYSSSGDPGTVQSIRLHGVGSLTASSTPLYIVDGIQSTERDVLAMNPNDIESMTVLKDASATSIYGSRAANGVIYVTTKRGASTSGGSGASIQVRAQYGISSMADKSFYDAMMSTQQLWGFWEETGIMSAEKISALQQSLTDQGIVRPDGSFHNTNWVDFMQKDNRPTYQADVAFSGGNDKTQYYVSSSIYDQDGTAAGTYFRRYTLTSNVDSKVNNWFRFGTNIRLSVDEKETNPNYDTNSTSGGLSFLIQPYLSPYLQDGSEPDIMPGQTRPNPYYYMDTHENKHTRYGGSVSAYLQIEPIKNLKLRVVPGLVGGINLQRAKYLPSYVASPGNGLVQKGTTFDYIATITNTAEYMFTVKDDHRITLLAGQEGIKNYYERYWAQSKGQQDDRLMHLQNGKQSTYTMNSEDTQSQYLSFFGRVDYGYKDKYYVDAMVRNDASSRFAKSNRNATFWALGAMWNISNESFMDHVSVAKDIRLKVSYGTQGNSSIGDYSSFSTIAEGSPYNQLPGWILNTPGNPNLSWEKQSKLTIAANATFLKKLTLGLEYYNRVSRDVLMDVPIPGTTGFNEVMKNTATIANNGIDITLSYNILEAKDYYLNFSTTFNYNSEKIKELFDGRQRWEVANTGVAYVVGEPVMYYFPILAGINSETGQQEWYIPGENKDVTTKDPSKTTPNFNETALTQNTGLRRYAPVTGGFNISGGWKGIYANANFAYVAGKNLISNDRFFSENPNQFPGFNTSSHVSDYWREPGDVAEYPDWSQGAVMQFDTHLIENASFMRLKDLTIGYQFPKNLLTKTKAFKEARVYFTGRNLWTIKSKDFKGIDPEVDSNLTLGRVGNSKQFVFGIDLTF